MKRDTGLGFIILGAFALFDCVVWYALVFAAPPRETTIHFLDVGQGDSTLVVFPGGVELLTDAGPDRRVVSALDDTRHSSDRYIDLAIISHPQLDHFGGFFELLKRYRFGVFIVNGRDADVPEWRSLIDAIRTRNIPLIVLGAGDTVKNGDTSVSFLSPDSRWLESGELNDTGLVELVESGGFRALLTADIGTNIEEAVLADSDIRADVLKVGHHGSKYSSGLEFLKIVRPQVALVGVGAGNRYGHPTDEALSRLASVGARVFRTDRDGTIRIVASGGTVRVFRTGNSAR